MLSSWQETRNRSRYHFDTAIRDPRWDCAPTVGKFVGSWQAELDQAIDASRPATWATRAPRPPDPVALAKEEYDLEQQGYGRDFEVTNLTWDIAPVFQHMADLFALDDAMVRIHVQWPGQVWNLHLDKLEKWCPENPNRVVRYFIALNDWQMGHFWNYGNHQHSHWHAGDVHTFDWQNVPHSTANAGHEPRVTLQVTGVATDITHHTLEQFKYQSYNIEEQQWQNAS